NLPEDICLFWYKDSLLYILLAVLEHFKVYFLQLAPQGLNKVTMFEVLCQSLDMEPMGSEVQAEAHGLSCVIQERIPNNTTLPDAPRIVIPTPRATRVIGIYAFLCMLEWEGSENNSRLLFRAKSFWPELKPPESKKPLLSWGFHRNRPIIRSSRADSSLRQLSNDGSEQEDQASESHTLDDDDLDMNDRGGNIGGQAMPPPQEIYTGFDPRGSGADDFGNQGIPVTPPFLHIAAEANLGYYFKVQQS
ncbi:hypothetical protein Tco_1472075, partial [Tanacetum coccineum]